MSLMILPDGGRSDRNTVWNVGALQTLASGDTGAFRYFGSQLYFWNGTAWMGLLGTTGTPTTFTPVHGAVLYSTATGIGLTAAPASSNRLLKGTVTGSPVWSDWFVDGSSHLLPVSTAAALNIGSDSARPNKLYINKIKRENEYFTRFSTVFAASANQVAYLDLGDVTAVAGMEITIHGGFGSAQSYGKVTKRFCWFRNSASTTFGFNAEEVVDAFGFTANVFSIGSPEIYNTSVVRIPIYQLSGGNTCIVEVRIWSDTSTSLGNLEGSITLTAPTTVANSAVRNHVSMTNSNLVISGEVSGGTTFIRSGAGTSATAALEMANGRHIAWKDNGGAFTNAGFILFSSANALVIGTANSSRWTVDGNGHLFPNAGTTYDIGTSSSFVRNSYLNQVNSNELLIGHSNAQLSRFLFAQSNSADRGLFNPIWEAIGSGRALFTDEEFATTSNSLIVYDNSAGGKTTHTRQTARDVVPNSTATWIKISYDGTGTPGSNPNPGFGGFNQNFTTQANKSYVVRFLAKIPSGYTLAFAANSTGVNTTSYWLTNNVGTNKWEQYAYVVHAGDAIGLNTISSISTAGTGYAAGNLLTLSGGTLVSPGGTAATVTVLTVDGGGGVLTASVTNRGRYVTAPASNPATTGGGGTGCSLNVTYLTFSTAGFTYIQTGGPNVAFDWYVAAVNVYEVNLSGLNYLNADKLSLGTVPSARVSGAYTSITGLGTLSSLTVTGTTALTGTTNQVGAFNQSGGDTFFAHGAAGVFRVGNTNAASPNIGIYASNATIQIQDQSGNPYILLNRATTEVGIGGTYETGYAVRARGLMKTDNVLLAGLGDAMGLRVTDVSSAASGAGLELQYDASVASGTSFVQSYDRTGAAFKKLHVRGSAVDLSTGGSVVMSISTLSIICNQQISSTVTTGTAPLQVTSTTKVTNFNSHYLGAVNQDDAFFKNSDAPVGTVVAFLKSFGATATPASNWVECNGQVLSDAGSIYNTLTLPDLNGATGGLVKRFLRGSSTSGTTGGSETHTHPITSSASSFSTGATSAINSVTTPTGATSTLPSYYEVVYIMRVK